MGYGCNSAESRLATDERLVIMGKTGPEDGPASESPLYTRTADSMKREPLASIFRTLLLAGALLAATMAFGDSTEDVSPETLPAPYAKRATLQETMLATRALFAETMPAQAAARTAVKLGPWHLSAAPFPTSKSVKPRSIWPPRRPTESPRG